MNSNAEIESLAEEIAKQNNITSYDLKFDNASKKGKGFIGQIISLSIYNKETKATSHFIVKTSIKNPQIRKLVPVEESFNNEFQFYSKIVPALERFQNERKVTEHFHSIPKCYISHLETLVLEDLNYENFGAYKAMDLDEEHVRFIFREYAKFHALGFAFKDQRRQEYGELVGKLVCVKEKMKRNMHLRSNFYDCAKIILDICEEKVPDLVGKVAKYFDHDLCFDLQMRREKFGTLIHVDSWINNFFFKYEEDGSKLTEFKILDWQMLKEGSPMMDLAYFFYCGALPELFDNVEHYLKEYHEVLSNFLRELGSDATVLYPWDILMEQWKTYCICGMLMTAWVLRLRLIHEEFSFDYDDIIADTSNPPGTLMNKAAFDRETYTKTILKLLKHFDKMNYL